MFSNTVPNIIKITAMKKENIWIRSKKFRTVTLKWLENRTEFASVDPIDEEEMKDEGRMVEVEELQLWYQDLIERTIRWKISNSFFYFLSSIPYFDNMR